MSKSNNSYLGIEGMWDSGAEYKEHITIKRMIQNKSWWKGKKLNECILLCQYKNK